LSEVSCAKTDRAGTETLATAHSAMATLDRRTGEERLILEMSKLNVGG
jgi:hypothetical protein